MDCFFRSIVIGIFYVSFFTARSCLYLDWVGCVEGVIFVYNLINLIGVFTIFPYCFEDIKIDWYAIIWTLCISFTQLICNFIIVDFVTNYSPLIAFAVIVILFCFQLLYLATQFVILYQNLIKLNLVLDWPILRIIGFLLIPFSWYVLTVK